MTITDLDYQLAAKELGCEVAAIRAVSSVEAAGSGFLPSGKCKILFEAHIFGRLTLHKYDASHPNISAPRWDKSLYKGGEAEWPRLEQAMALDSSAALSSASWGRFQIMGFNFKIAGYKTVEEFVSAMKASEGAHLRAFVKTVQSMGLADELRRRDWAGFARIYNGAAYAANHYDTKMATAYAMFAKGQ